MRCAKNYFYKNGKPTKMKKIKIEQAFSILECIKIRMQDCYSDIVTFFLQQTFGEDLKYIFCFTIFIVEIISQDDKDEHTSTDIQDFLNIFLSVLKTA